ncbi:MAG: DNA-processing protein DprA [Flavobacteriales bacterium]
MDYDERLFYTIGLGLLEGIGPVNARKLIAFAGSAEQVFKQKRHQLMRTPGVGEVIASAIHTGVLERAEKEMEFIRRNKIRASTFLDSAFPQRLKNCEDAPLVLFSLGNTDFNTSRIVSIVGTRQPSEKGKEICATLVEQLAGKGITVVSGLAYGIDICAHRTSLQHAIPTVGVLAHGLDRIYPGAHRSTAEKMLEQGGLLTEFISETNPDRENFPKRNRIVAGMSDATIVIETGNKGGSIITAMLANDYNRDVFAFPGRPGDEKSSGCNRLIKIHRAALTENANDILLTMGWEENNSKKNAIQIPLFPDLDPDEKTIYDLLHENNPTGIDALCMRSNWPMSKVSALLLTMEFKGVVKSFPGKLYGV